MNIASYPRKAGADTDFNNPVRLNSFSETSTARFLLKETDQWLFGTFRTSAQTALYNFEGYTLYEGNIIEITGGTAPSVSGEVNNPIVTWGIVFEDLDGISDIDFATLKIEKKIINQDYGDVPGVFMVRFMELLNNGNVIMERTDTRLSVTFNTSY